MRERESDAINTVLAKAPRRQRLTYQSRGRTTNTQARLGQPASDRDDPTTGVAELTKLGQLGSALRQARRYSEAADAFARICQAVPDDWLAQYNAGAVLLEAARLPESVAHLERALLLRETTAAHSLHGHVLALLGDMSAARTAYESAVRLSPGDDAANWGLFEVNQLLGDTAAALRHQRTALAQRSLRTVAALVQPARTTILELCVAGTFQANIPLDFILSPERTTVHKLYLGEHPIPRLPPYDLVFNTIADAPDAGPALRAAESFIAGQNRPALNTPLHVPLTSRVAIAEMFARSATVAVAPTRHVDRSSIAHDAPAYPYLIRPLDSHAGTDLARIHDPGELDAYFGAVTHAHDFYVSAFIDYRNADGYYRKYRIAFVDGVPYPVHLAISPRWMIHYYNAPMAENAWMREEEHAFMRDLAGVFTGPAAAGLREIAARIPLDYFGIDCSLSADGRVLLFEASAAMIVHTRDPVDLYPYKAKYVPRVIQALERLFDTRLQRRTEP